MTVFEKLHRIYKTHDAIADAFKLTRQESGGGSAKEFRPGAP